MVNEKYRKTSIAFGHLIQQLYGQNDFSRIRKRHTLSSLRNYYLKILKTFKISINETISISDKNQVEFLNAIIMQGQNSLKSADTFDFLDSIFIEVQAKIIFQLLGIVPDRWSNKNVPNRKEFWKLNSHRQIQYVQNEKQKENLIFSLLQSKYSDRFPNFMHFVENVYWNQCNRDFKNLLIWLKYNHPDIYNEII